MNPQLGIGLKNMSYSTKKIITRLLKSNHKPYCDQFNLGAIFFNIARQMDSQKIWERSSTTKIHLVKLQAIYL